MNIWFLYRLVSWVKSLHKVLLIRLILVKGLWLCLWELWHVSVINTTQYPLTRSIYVWDTTPVNQCMFLFISVYKVNTVVMLPQRDCSRDGLGVTSSLPFYQNPALIYWLLLSLLILNLFRCLGMLVTASKQGIIIMNRNGSFCKGTWVSNIFAETKVDARVGQ